MFLYKKDNKSFNLVVDIFISSVTVTALIFHVLVLIGYISLSFVEIKCQIQPLLETYMTLIGALSIATIAIVLIMVLSSHDHKETCISQSNSSKAR